MKGTHHVTIPFVDETIPPHLGFDTSSSNSSTATGCCDSSKANSSSPVELSEGQWWSQWIRICCSNILPDEPIKLRGRKKMYGKVPVFMEDVDTEHMTSTIEQNEEDSFLYAVENPQVVRLLKFFIVTMIYILITYYIVRWMDLEHDPNYSLKDFFLYDFNLVALDIVSYFIVGRLFLRDGVDCLFPMLFFMGSGCLVPSWTNTFKFLQHSVSAYEIVCRWPWQLFVYGIGVILISSAILSYHVALFYQQKILISRSVELLLCLAIFLLPFVHNPSFHLHHWYVSWMLGMHANSDTWWSKATLAYLWGNYINGVAVYGRDPILSCAYPFYLSTTNLHCEYMSCYSSTSTTAKNVTIYKPYIAPDWHNCSANHYHM